MILHQIVLKAYCSTLIRPFTSAHLTSPNTIGRIASRPTGEPIKLLVDRRHGIIEAVQSAPRLRHFNDASGDMGDPRTGLRLLMILSASANGAIRPRHREIGLGALVEFRGDDGRIEDGDGHRRGMNPTSMLSRWYPLNPQSPSFICEIFGSLTFNFQGKELVTSALIRSHGSAALSKAAVGQLHVSGGEFSDEDFCVESTFARS